MQTIFSTILLQGPQPNPNFTFFLMGGMFIVMYFFMIRPQAKKAKEQKAFAESIAVDEQVVTTAGIHGRINRVNDDGTLQLDLGRNTFVTMERSAVSMEMTVATRKKKDAAAAPTTATVTK